jgi:hypothetical protein
LAWNQLVARNIVLGQTNVVVFSNGQLLRNQVKQVNNLSIVTIAFFGEFANKNQKLNQKANFSIIANSKNQELITVYFWKIIKMAIHSRQPQ